MALGGPDASIFETAIGPIQSYRLRYSGRERGYQAVAEIRRGGRQKVLAAIHDPDSTAKVLGAMGLSAAVPELAPARGPNRTTLAAYPTT